MSDRDNEDFDNDEDFNEPREQSEHEEWLEDDNARRYREWQSDNSRPY